MVVRLLLLVIANVFWLVVPRYVVRDGIMDVVGSPVVVVIDDSGLAVDVSVGCAVVIFKSARKNKNNACISTILRFVAVK